MQAWENVAGSWDGWIVARERGVKCDGHCLFLFELCPVFLLRSTRGFRSDWYFWTYAALVRPVFDYGSVVWYPWWISKCGSGSILTSGTGLYWLQIPWCADCWTVTSAPETPDLRRTFPVNYGILECSDLHQINFLIVRGIKSEHRSVPGIRRNHMRITVVW